MTGQILRGQPSPNRKPGSRSEPGFLFLFVVDCLSELFQRYLDARNSFRDVLIGGGIR